MRIERDGAVRTLVLDRADKRNALSAALVDALLDAVAEAEADGVRLLVFRGEGRNFSAGFDFGDVESQSEGDLLLRFVRVEQLLQAVAGSRCMTLALAHGRNFGAGVDLFAACRHRVASADSSFRMPGLKFGLVLGTRRLGALIGPEQASALLEAEPAEWPGVVAALARKADELDDWSRAALYGALSTAQADTDLATLVRSAARPGLKARIARYLQG
ncbi:enoyl-CoA hydratase/isomerase family protein [Piscinibacter sakaiensis]|uniref:enoyl-CoA hydratase/isomerase family protein n=1 Tax=Piscinibacter sakaiensis TaxID=1547922 RepID=UPI0037292806